MKQLDLSALFHRDTRQPPRRQAGTERQSLNKSGSTAEATPREAAGPASPSPQHSIQDSGVACRYSRDGRTVFEHKD